MKISELSEEFQLINDSNEIAEIRDFLRLDMNDCGLKVKDRLPSC